MATPNPADLQAAVHATNLAMRLTTDPVLAQAIAHERRILSMWLDGYRQALELDRLMGEPQRKFNLVDLLGLDSDSAVAICHSGQDGDCSWDGCPQERDGEPAASGRPCPLYSWDDRASEAQ